MEERTMIERVEQMPVYQLFFELAVEVERVTQDFGPDFRWLRVQVLKSSESVCANMSEGFYAQYSTEYVQSLYRCRREGRETTSHIRYAEAVRQLPAATAANLLSRYEDGLKQLANLISSIERKIQERGKAKPNASVLHESKAAYGATEEESGWWRSEEG
jgi:four helix bundle protein